MAIDLLKVGPSFWGDMRKNHGTVLDATELDIKNGGPDHVADLLKTPLTISGTPVLTGQNGVAYTGFTVAGRGGVPPYVYSFVGTWPTGLAINSSTGAVTGTPTEAGTFAGLSVEAEDADGNTAQLAPFTLVIDPA